MTQKIFAASVALLADDLVLLIERARPPYRGHWTLPGGRIEPGEAPEDCARREIREELGITVRTLTPLMSMQVGPGIVGALMVFATRDFGGPVVPSEEIASYRWLRSEALPGLVTTPNLERAVNAAFTALRAG